jgi:hypothetical protein
VQSRRGVMAKLGRCRYEHIFIDNVRSRIEKPYFVWYQFFV